ncbi:hypothetical protein SLEP1_g46233 [Rubroshorea leprosula]|uniref:Protein DETOXIFICATION n=1 Tax=Rubroshorea leprosula TaxID=152421 RepID=A0AAV5LMG1_9ROSI|nr:hypothetical protein SLEP1_g46233 [Rubroshorea leprosula]
MSLDTTSETGEPLLKAIGGGGHGEGSWWGNVLDVEEAKSQVLFALPMILTNVFYYSITLVSVMFARLSGALETLCGQGFGAKLYRMLGIYLQVSCIISCFFAVVISILWFYTEPILILLKQDAQICKMAALYMKLLIPGVFAYGFLQNILIFLQTQSIVTPLILLSLLPMGIHFGIVYMLVNWTSLGYKGAPLAASISLWISCLMLAIYVMYSKKFKHTWEGFSFESFRFILRYLRLALSSAAMVCLEDWASEVLVFLAGIMPNSKITTSLIATCANTETIAYMITYGLSAAASTRVSNELGAGNPERAKNAMAVTLRLSVLLALAFILTLAFGHNIWASFFSDSSSIINEFAAMTPFLAISIALDSIQGVLSGVARGSGWQHLAVLANLGTFYLVGMPVAAVFGFLLKLYAKVSTSDELYNASPYAPTGSIEDDLPTNNALDNFEPSSTSSSISPIDIASDIVVFPNELVVPFSSRPTQEYGIDYEETFAQVAHLTSMRSLLAIVVIQKWKFFQMDVKNAFLNALFIHKTTWGMVLLLVYVDDMIITGDDITCVEELKQSLNQKFEMKDLGVLSYFLGLEVTYLDDGYLLSQVKYASDLVSTIELSDSKSVSTPLEPNVKLTPMDGSPLFDSTHYRQLVGNLVYLTTTRPDITYAIHIVSQFIATPCSTHYVTVLRIIRYVKGTLFHGLHFSAHSSLKLRAYSDAYWAGDSNDRISTIGYCLFLSDSLISWRSKKHAVLSHSSTEAKYQALGDTTSELLNLCWLLEVFKYKKGSDLVLLVNKDDYDTCKTKNPIQRMDNGNSRGESAHAVSPKLPPGSGAKPPVVPNPKSAAPGVSPVSHSPGSNPPSKTSPAPVGSPVSRSPGAKPPSIFSPGPSGSPAVFPAPGLHTPQDRQVPQEHFQHQASHFPVAKPPSTSSLGLVGSPSNSPVAKTSVYIILSTFRIPRNISVLFSTSIVTRLQTLLKGLLPRHGASIFTIRKFCSGSISSRIFPPPSQEGSPVPATAPGGSQSPSRTVGGTPANEVSPSDTDQVINNRNSIKQDSISSWYYPQFNVENIA